MKYLADNNNGEICPEIDVFRRIPTSDQPRRPQYDQIMLTKDDTLKHFALYCNCID